MTTDLVQARYDDLIEVAHGFERAAESARVLDSSVRNAYRPLQQGSWLGRGVVAFSTEMERDLLPALIRLADSMATAGTTTQEMSKVLQEAERLASSLFSVSPGAEQGLDTHAHVEGSVLTGSELIAGNILPVFGAGVDAMIGGMTAGGTFSPVSLWATAPFAAGSVVFGPGPIPLFGRMGRVPSGFSNAGSRLWLYFGGQGTDTVFSIHPHEGWGRAPRNLKTPNVRLDYGFVNTKSGMAFLPNGTKVPVPRNVNLFHWNQQGGFGLWKTSTGGLIHDHQLLSNAVPKGNIVGRISGASFVRGASRAFAAVGVGMDVYSVATADNKVQEATRRGAAWGGAWLGAKGGAIAGAAIGSIFPGPGTAIGGAIGGIAGGIGGYLGGFNVGDWAYDKLN